MGYRDDELALAHREATLAQALDHCDAELERLRILERRREEIARELHDVRAQRRTRRPDVEGMKPTSPCRAQWAMMEGDDCSRACHLCGKRVYELNGGAARLLADEGALALGRLRRRADGTVVVGDCPRGALATRRRRAVVGGGTAFVVATAVAAAAAAPSPPSAPQAAHVVDPQGLAGAPAVGATEVELDDEIAVDVDR